MKKQFSLLLLSSLIFAVLASVLQVYENSELDSYRHGDCFTYEVAGNSIYEDGFAPHSIRPMLYPLFVGFPRLFTDNYWITLAFNYALNFIFWLLTILFIYKSIQLILKPKYAFLLAFLFAFNVSNILLNPQILTESIYTFWLSLIMFLLAKYFLNNKINYLTAVVSLLILSILIRPTGLVLIYLITPIFIAYLIKNQQFMQIVVVLFFCLFPLFQAYKMQENKMNFTVSNIGSCALYLFLCSYAEGIKDTNYDYFNFQRLTLAYGKVRDERRANLRAEMGENYWEKFKNTANEDLKYQLKTNYKALIFTYVRNIISNSSAFSFFALHLDNVRHRPYFNFIKKASVIMTKIQNFFYSFSLILTPFFLYYFRKKIVNKRLFYLQLSLLFLAFYIILISGISFAQGDRFNIVLVPIALLNIALMYPFIRPKNTPSVF